MNIVSELNTSQRRAMSACLNYKECLSLIKAEQQHWLSGSDARLQAVNAYLDTRARYPDNFDFEEFFPDMHQTHQRVTEECAAYADRKNRLLKDLFLLKKTALSNIGHHFGMEGVHLLRSGKKQNLVRVCCEQMYYANRFRHDHLDGIALPPERYYYDTEGPMLTSFSKAMGYASARALAAAVSSGSSRPGSHIDPDGISPR